MSGANPSKMTELNLSLSQIPFNSLDKLLKDMCKNTSRSRRRSRRSVSHAQYCKGVQLPECMLEGGILKLLLASLASLGHHPHRQREPHFADEHVRVTNSALNCCFTLAHITASSKKTTLVSTASGFLRPASVDVNGNFYWSKGTGFGAGPTAQQWNPRETLNQQKLEEENVLRILGILGSYLEWCGEELSDQAVELLDHSCVISALASYLGNDSVLDISRHFDLYEMSLKLLQELIANQKLRPLTGRSNMFELVKNMKQLVESYTNRIKQASKEDSLIRLLSVLKSTFDSLNSLVKPGQEPKPNPVDLSSISPEEVEKAYCLVMKELQYDAYPITSQVVNGRGAFKANVPYYYESSLNQLTQLNNANRAKRLAQESVTLSKSLPLSFSSSVLIRCDEERLDVMKVLITGPQGTPYANGCFEFDVFFPSDYPTTPPMINLATTGNNTVRFNPNLYQDGKVCLSILNTWNGRPEERWNGQVSSLLQVHIAALCFI